MPYKMSLDEYVNHALDDPKLRRTTSENIMAMFDYFGTKEIFSEIYGMDKAIKKINDFVHDAGSHGLSEFTYLMLVGPPGGGKTETIDAMKKHYELFSKLDEGQLWAVDGCPYNQHPFDLLPEDERNKIGIQWYPTAVPCPICQEKKERGEDISTKRIYVSEISKTALASHTSTTRKKEDISQFIGDINLKKLGEEGSKYIPSVWECQGRFAWANRGIFDWREMLKSSPQLQSILLEVIGSKRFDLLYGRQVHVDFMLIVGSNVEEYERFVEDPDLRALIDRANVVYWPYTTQRDEEVKIYQKALRRMSGKKHVHPNALDFLADYVIATRPKGEDEGMRGLSPRIGQRVATFAYSAAERCVSLSDVEKSIRQRFEMEPAIRKMDRKELEITLEKVKGEQYKALGAKIRDAVIPTAFSDLAQNLYLNYLDKASLWAAKNKSEAELKKDDEDLKAIEELIPISSKGRKAFRTSIASRANELRELDYTHNAKLASAINAKIFGDIKDSLRLSAKDKLSKKDKAIREKVRQALAGYAFCDYCAEDFFDHVDEIL
ncbi:MAG: hypothetical protein QMD14_00290 [Candidatus Aenigmarchaeota archaeon]|nr:hypothetical protein [Candidatus Aenigmarchaeota archaeon]